MVVSEMRWTVCSVVCVRRMQKTGRASERCLPEIEHNLSKFCIPRMPCLSQGYLKFQPNAYAMLSSNVVVQVTRSTMSRPSEAHLLIVVSLDGAVFT